MIIFEKRGSGQPLILIHGFCESKEMWITFSKELAKTHTVYAIDLPGITDHHIPKEFTTLENVAVIIHDWMEDNHIHNPIVIGHSLGGYVTLALAELMGSGLKAIGLFHSTALSDNNEKRKTRNNTITFIKKHGVDKFIDSFVPPLFSEQHRIALQEKIDKLITSGKNWSKEGVIAYITAMRDRKDRMEVWENFKGKKLMIVGVLDVAVNIEASRMHKPFVDNYCELEDVGHMGMFEAEKESLNLVRSFLENIS